MKGLESAGIKDLENACKLGVERAYNSVLTPTEGTILTVAKETSNAVSQGDFDCIEDIVERSLDEAKRALEKILTMHDLAISNEKILSTSGVEYRADIKYRE